jgi:hypothetical protein
MLSLSERDPGIEAATDDLYEAAAAFLTDVTASILLAPRLRLPREARLRHRGRLTGARRGEPVAPCYYGESVGRARRAVLLCPELAAAGPLAASKIDRIFKGASPAERPVAQISNHPACHQLENRQGAGPCDRARTPRPR